MRYETPNMELVVLTVDDIITSSIGNDGDGKPGTEPVVPTPPNWG